MTVDVFTGPPKLTLPPAEAEWLTEHYSKARVILEYGSGGSTRVASEQAGTTVFSVENDLGWAAAMGDYFAENPPRGVVHMHPVNVGQTGKWGWPVNEKGWRFYPDYPISVWDREDFVQPDLVLIDGRFRAACLLATAIRTEQPVTVLFDDYTERDKYHEVEQWFERKETRGRMVRFEVEPWTIPPKDLAQVLAIFQRQN